MSSEEELPPPVDVDYNVRSRPARSTAGNRYAKLLQGELEKQKDDFYSSTYGGFNESESDDDFKAETLEDDDVLDSDYNTDEDAGDDGGDEANPSDGETEGKRRTKRVLTRAYKEPKAKTTPSAPRQRTDRDRCSVYVTPSDISLRRTTTEKRQASEAALDKPPTAAKRPRFKGKHMTQEQRLAEAKKVEVENIASLEKFLKLEEEKKIKRQVKKVDRGPLITFKSTTEKKSVFVDSDANTGSSSYGTLKTETVSKNVIIFPSEEVLNENFAGGSSQPQVKPQLFCPITKKPAKYLDPLTQQPYATMNAFKILRQIYKLKLAMLHSRGELYGAS